MGVESMDAKAEIICAEGATGLDRVVMSPSGARAMRVASSA